jgi:hypothetical protein
VLYGSPPEGLALQPDGKVAFPIPRPGGFELAWASPAEPRPHPLGVKSRELAPFAMAADRIAYIRRDDPAVYGGPVGVVGLDGNGTAPRIDAPAADFDGRRLVGLQQPCGAQVVAEWDLAGDPPRVPPGRCPAAKGRPASTRLDPNRVLRLSVTCPAEPALGCRGAAAIRGRPVWRRDPSGERKVAFDLDAGETQTLPATVWWSSICHARGGKATLDVRTTSGGFEDRDHPAGVSRASFRVSNVGPLPRACRKRR